MAQNFRLGIKLNYGIIYQFEDASKLQVKQTFHVFLWKAYVSKTERKKIMCRHQGPGRCVSLSLML